mmetsp:Transcript_1992/g.4811  ORF Transcript_1992/g.4811 Transcript_1992/m.4811 type:complete len:139 (-) Transcript_1992:305-721(-)
MEDVVASPTARKIEVMSLVMMGMTEEVQTKVARASATALRIEVSPTAPPEVETRLPGQNIENEIEKEDEVEVVEEEEVEATCRTGSPRTLRTCAPGLNWMKDCGRAWRKPWLSERTLLRRTCHPCGRLSKRPEILQGF